MDISSTSNAQAAVQTIQDAIQDLATIRANNGAEQSRLTFAADMLSINKINLEAANSRIVDVDVAAESSQLARFNILQQAGTAMLAQANQSTQSILRLIS
jgi:flagellin